MNCSPLRYVLFRNWKSIFPFATAATWELASEIAMNEVAKGRTVVIYDDYTKENIV